MATLDELTTPLTKDEVEAAIYAAIEARGVAVTGWKSGAVARVIISAASIMLSAFSTLQQRIAQSGFLELASGDWLALVALHVYGVTKDAGSFASGNITVDNTAGGVFAPGVGDVIALNTTSGKTFRNTAAFTLAAFETGAVVPFEAIEIGTDSNSVATLIDGLETTMNGVTVTNPLAFIATDEDTDPELRAKCLAKTGTLSPNGPADAYRFVAFAAATDDGSPTGITRLTTVPDGQGNIIVYVANATGPVTGTIGDTTTDLGAVDDAIQTQVVPLAVTATTTSAVALGIAVTYELWVKGTVGLTASEIISNVDAAISTYLSAQPIGGNRKIAGGGFIFKEAVEAVISEAVGSAFLIDKSVTLPALDLAVAANEAPASGTITPTVNLVSL